MDLDDYLREKKEIYHSLLEFLDTNSDSNDSFKQLTDIFNIQSIRQSKEDITTLFHIIVNISNYHHRTSDFFRKIEQVLTFFETDIQQYYTNDEIFNIFKSSKRILLFLIEKELFKINESIVQIITNGIFKRDKYPFYFYPEIKPFLSQKFLIEMSQNTSDMSDINSEEFESNRKKAENHRYICELIQKDSIDDFIIYVTKNSIQLSSKIIHSIFETNRFLLNMKEIDLLSYSAFYGSIQIFNYLYMNKVETPPILWLHSIHGRNPEIIHLLEYYHVQPYVNSYETCFTISLISHHNEIAKYFEDNFLDDKKSLSKSVKFFNFEYFERNLIDDIFSFYYACKYDNPYIVKYIIEHSKNLNTNSIINDSNKKQTGLSAAISEGNKEVVKILLSQPDIDVLIKSKSCYKSQKGELDRRFGYQIEKSPLHEAVEKEDIEMVELLLSNSKIDVNDKLEYHDNGIYGSYHIEKTALNIAIEKGNLKIIEFLLNHPNIDVNQISRHNDGSYEFPDGNDRYIEKIALIIAVENENTEIVSLLLNHPKIDVNIVSKYHDYKYHGFKGFKENEYQERTALQIAIKKNNIKIIQLLLNHPKIDVNNHLIVCNYNHIDILEEQYKTDFNIYYNSFNTDNFLLNDISIEEEKNISLLDEDRFRSFVNINLFHLHRKVGREEKSPLFISVENQNADVVQCLVNCQKIDINYKSIILSDKGKLEEISPLRKAIIMNNSKIVHLLMEHGGIDT